MKDTRDNLVASKSKAFALRIIRLYKELIRNRQEYVLGKQLLRSGTSVGANIREAIRAQSKPDFISKMGISLKEASESEYWLELLFEAEYISEIEYESIITDCRELISLLTAIIKSSKGY